MLGLGSIGCVQSFQYVLINIEPIRPSDYSQFVFLALCVFDFDIPGVQLSVSNYEGIIREKNFNCACVRSTLYSLWPNALDNAQQRSTILRLTKLHSTNYKALDFTQQGGQTLSTFHSTCMSSRSANEGGVGGVTPPNNFNTRFQLQFDGDKSVPLWACMYRISVYNTLSCKQLCRCCDLFALTYFLGWTDLITGY